jgi:CRP/FNR family transcriptional regulator, anaerobic regulatory protein
MNLQQIKSYYQNLLPAMQQADWEALSSRFTYRQLKKGDFLTRNGEVCRQVSFLNKGLIRIFYAVDGKEINTGFVAENNYIAEYASFLVQQPAHSNLDALEESEVINLSYDDMQLLYQTNPVFQIFGRKIAEMLFVLLVSQNTTLLTLSPEERYQTLINYQPYVIQRVPQYMIASFIGITPEHLSRIRKKMSSSQAD